MIDFDAYAKFSQAAPRFTSYPTAIEFSEKFTYSEYLEELKKAQGKTLSLYFHLPFCKSACYFCGCNVIYTSKQENLERYIKYLEKEMELLSQNFDCSKEVVQLHFGGGTPTYYNAEQLQRIIKNIKKYFPNFSQNAELSCEIDPRYLNEEQMQVLSQEGFNRISFGVQDFDEKVQKEINRVQPFEMTKKAVDLARKYGITSINIDLIYGLVYQNLESFTKTLELSLKLNPDRFAVFNYAHVPWLKKSMRKFDESKLPSPKVKLELLKKTYDVLTNNGYEMIGMDHYAKPEDELFQALKNGDLHRNFQGYTTKSEALLLGIGLTSISDAKNFYAQNSKEMKEYEAALDEGKLPYKKGILLSQDDKIRKEVIMNLMSNFAINIEKIEEKFSINFQDYFKTSLEKLKKYEEFLEENTAKSIKVTLTGRLLIRNIAMNFDAYQKDEKANIFSKSI